MKINRSEGKTKSQDRSGVRRLFLVTKKDSRETRKPSYNAKETWRQMQRCREGSPVDKHASRRRSYGQDRVSGIGRRELDAKGLGCQGIESADPGRDKVARMAVRSSPRPGYAPPWTYGGIRLDRGRIRVEDHISIARKEERRMYSCEQAVEKD